jgi:HSP20 family molecular chaperone IbpA
MKDESLYEHAGLGRIRIHQRGRDVYEGAYFRPPTDVCETDDSVVVTVEVAGLEDGAYAVTLSNADRTLTVSGRRHLPGVEARVTYHQLEIQQGKFVSQVYLPWALSDTEEVTASYVDGFLVVNLPKARPRQVPVRAVVAGQI